MTAFPKSKMTTLTLTTMTTIISKSSVVTDEFTEINKTCQGTVLWQVFIRRFEKIQRNNTAKIEIIQREPCRWGMAL